MIYDREQFAELRKEVVGASCKETYKKVEEYNKIKSWVQYMEEKYPKEVLFSRYDYREAKEYLYHTQQPSIRKRFLDDLEWAGLNKEDAGTKHIATIATIFFHERKLYQSKDISDRSYWNLSDFNNEHYGMLGLPKEQVVCDILDVMSKNDDIHSSHEELIYEMADSLGVYGYDRDEEELKPYSDMPKRAIQKELKYMNNFHKYRKNFAQMKRLDIQK